MGGWQTRMRGSKEGVLLLVEEFWLALWHVISTVVIPLVGFYGNGTKTCFFFFVNSDDCEYFPAL